MRWRDDTFKPFAVSTDMARKRNEGDLLWVAPSIPVTCKIPLNLPFLKEENCGVLFLTSIYSCRCEDAAGRQSNLSRIDRMTNKK